MAGPGSGAATIAPPDPVVAGSSGSWTIDFEVHEDFHPVRGGVVTVTIPAGWSAPVAGSLIEPGHVEVSGPGTSLDSVVVVGQEIRVFAGADPGDRVLAGDHLVVSYGVPAPAGAAAAQSNAPATAVFAVASNPDEPEFPVPLTLGSPALSVIASPALYLSFEPANLDLEAGVPAFLYLAVFDRYGNPSPPGADQLVSLTAGSPTLRVFAGGVPGPEVTIPADSAGVTLTVVETMAGSTVPLRAADGDVTPPALTPALATVSTVAGPAARLVVAGVLDPIVAGEQASVGVEALDAHGNRAADYAGTVRFMASDQGSGVTLPADYTFTPADQGFHLFAGEIVLATTGEHRLSAEDSVDPQISGVQAEITVLAGPAARLAVSGIADPLAAGVPSDVLVEVFDAFGNLAADYQGVVSFATDDPHPGVLLPAPYTFGLADSGRRLFPDAVRLMTAGSHLVAAEDPAAGLRGEQTAIDVVAGPPATAVLLPPGSVPVTAGGEQGITLAVADAAGNAVAGEAATIAIVDPADGTLAPDPAHPGGTEGGPTAQSGRTDAEGRLRVRYLAPDAAGRVDSLDAWTAALGAGTIAGIELTTNAAGATRLVFTPAVPIADTAFAAIALGVEAEDSYGNQDPGATPRVRLAADSPSARFSTDSGATWSAGPLDSLVLAGGTSGGLIRVRDPRAGSFTVTAADAAGFLAAAAHPGVTLVPAPAAGPIPLVAVPDTLTADGRSAAPVAGGPVTDRHGNAVADRFVTVATTLGTLVAVDESAAPGIQRRTDAAGRFAVSVRAAETPGDALISATSGPGPDGGTAAGTVAVHFAPQVRLALVPHTLDPASAAPGDTIDFRIVVQNLGPTAATLAGGTAIRLGEPGGVTYASALAAPATVPAGQVGELRFTRTRVDPALPPGQYTPLLSLRGSDARGADIDTLIAGDVDAFGVVSLVLGAVTAPARVARGQTGVEVEVEVVNLGASPVLVTGVDLSFSAPAYAERGVAPALPHSVAPRATESFTVTVDVDPLASLGAVSIDATAAYQTGGGPRAATGAVPDTWIVDTAAQVTPVAGSLAPVLVASGQTHAASVVVANAGMAGVVLDPAATRLTFGPGGNPLAVGLAQATYITGGGSTALRFADLVVPAGYPAGRWPVRLDLSGLEHGAPYGASLLLPDSLSVAAPAALALATQSVTPDSVSLGQLHSFSLRIVNNGGGDITVREGTLLRLSGAVAIELALAGGERTIGPGAGADCVFGPGEIAPALGPGGIPLTVVVLTREHGIEGAVSLSVPAPLVVESPAVLRWVGGSLDPDRVTRGQRASFRLRLANDGGAPVEVRAGSELQVTDGVHRFSASYAGPTAVVAGGEDVTLTFPEEPVPADLAAQAYAPRLEVAAAEHGVPGTPVVTAPAGELVVEAPVDLRYVPGTLAPRLAVAGQLVAFQAAVENRGGAALRPAAATVIEVAGLVVPIDMLRTTAELAAGAVDTLYFATTALQSVGVGLHTPALDFHGTDWNGEPVVFAIDLAPDQLSVVTAAALRVVELASAAPRGARVNRGQPLPLRLRVANPRAEGVVGGNATVSGPGLAAPVTIPLGAIAGGDTASYALAAVAAGTAGSALVTAALQGGAGVLSGLGPEILPALDDTLRLAIATEAALAARLALHGPAGTLDGVASSGSLVDLLVTVDNQGQAPIGSDGTVTLAVPAGYGILGPSEQRFTAGADVPFAVVVPPAAAARDSFAVVISAVPLDLNTNGEAQVSAGRATVAIETVAAARLALAASIVEPVNARSGVALPGQEVTIEALVTNEGTAAAPGAGTLAIALGDARLALASGEPVERSFTVGDPVRWRVVAAAESSPPLAISVRAVAAPPDENTGLPAALARPEAALGLATQAVAAELAGAPLAIPAPALLRGGAPVAVLSFTVANAAPAAHAVVLEEIVPALARLAVEENGAERLTGGAAEFAGRSAADLGATFARLELRRDAPSGELVASWTGAGPPALALSDTLAGQETRAYVLLAGVAASAEAGTYRLTIGEPGALALRDPISGEPVPFVLAAGLVESAPLTLYERPLAAPNPFAPGRDGTRITYLLAEDSAVDIEIFTLYGDRVWSRTLVGGTPGGRSGLNQVDWDGRNDAGAPVRNGVYHCRIRGGGIDSTVKIAAIR